MVGRPEQQSLDVVCVRETCWGAADRWGLVAHSSCARSSGLVHCSCVSSLFAPFLLFGCSFFAPLRSAALGAAHHSAYAAVNFHLESEKQCAQRFELLRANKFTKCVCLLSYRSDNPSVTSYSLKVELSAFCFKQFKIIRLQARTNTLIKLVGHVSILSVIPPIAS